MKTLKYMSLCLGAVILTACHTPPKIMPSQVQQGAYVLDPSHTSVVWSLKHAGLSNYTARFNTVSGSLDFNSDSPESSHVDIRIDPASISTGDSEFDETIAQGGSYFNAEDYPDIRFTSTSIKLTGENTGLITGDLMFRGKTLPITLDTVFNGAGKSFGHKGQTLGFSATATLTRSDFGLKHLIAFGIGDEVTLRIETEFNAK